MKFSIISTSFFRIFYVHFFLLFSSYLIAQGPCPPPPGCNSNAIFACNEVTSFAWAAFPNGTGNYNIQFFRYPNENQVTFTLVRNGVAVSSFTGFTGEFTNITPQCYQLYICVSGNNQPSYYCCQTIPCDYVNPGCCKLRYSFMSSNPNAVWNFGDGTTATGSNVIHEYSNLNTYPIEGSPSVNVSVGAFFSTINFQPGIWIGKDCFDSGDVSAINNSISPQKKVLVGLTQNDKSISIKGSVTMSQNYIFGNCNICMNPGSRLVSTSQNLTFNNNTLLHDATCKNQSWYGIELRSGQLTANSANFIGAYNAIISVCP